MMKLKKNVKREKKRDAHINIEGQLGNPIF
jgi:hypothetical protein